MLGNPSIFFDELLVKLNKVRTISREVYLYSNVNSITPQRLHAKHPRTVFPLAREGGIPLHGVSLCIPLQGKTLLFLLTFYLKKKRVLRIPFFVSSKEFFEENSSSFCPFTRETRERDTT